jgi:hypothetical protein
VVLKVHNGCSQKKNSRMGLQDTTSVHICSKNSNIINAHGKDQMIKKPWWKKSCSKISLSSSQAEEQRFLVNKIWFTN